MTSPTLSPLSAEARPLHPELAAVAAQVHRVTNAIEVLVKGMHDHQINWTPTPGRWSIAQCLEHLTMSNAAYLQAVEAAIESGRKNNQYSSGPYHHPWLGKKFVGALEPGKGIKAKAAKTTTPASELSAAKVSSEFYASNQAIIAVVHRANGLDLGEVRVTSPFLKLLKVSLGQALQVFAAHERRHLEQARAVRAERGFPTE